MNLRVKRLLQFLLVNDIGWFIASPFVYIARRLSKSRENFLNRKMEDTGIALTNELFSKKEVLNGLFKGLRFNGIEATGSSSYAKLLGSYELELAPDLQRLLAKPYHYLINVGCDEGYYAVGIAAIKPGIKVIAFDCNEKAQQRCRSLAVLNNVAAGITVKACFSENDIASVDGKVPGLFVIDCEGCENEIITPALIQKFTGADFIIELHYDQRPLVFTQLQQFFAATHSIKLITALSDHERVMNYSFTELEGLSYQQKMLILEERVGFMQWLIAEPLG